MVEVFFIPDNEQDVNYFKWTEDNTFRDEFCIELMNSLVKKYGKKVIFDILENPEKMKEKFRVIFTDPVNFGKGYHDTTDDCYRRIIDFLDEHKKIETTITIKVQHKVSGKFLYLVLNKS